MFFTVQHPLKCTKIYLQNVGHHCQSNAMYHTRDDENGISVVIKSLIPISYLTELYTSVTYSLIDLWQQVAKVPGGGAGHPVVSESPGPNRRPESLAYVPGSVAMNLIKLLVPLMIFKIIFMCIICLDKCFSYSLTFDKVFPHEFRALIFVFVGCFKVNSHKSIYFRGHMMALSCPHTFNNFLYVI